jgi:hypothetical protein
MHYANTLGTARVLDRFRQYNRDGRLGTPAPLLERLAADNQPFA